MEYNYEKEKQEAIDAGNKALRSLTDPVLHHPVNYETIKKPVCKGKKIPCLNIQITGYIHIIEFSAEIS